MIKTVEEVMKELGIDEEKTFNELTDEELLKLYNACDEYISDQCEEICRRADYLSGWETNFLEEWEYEDVNFEDVLARAVKTIETTLTSR